MIRYADTLTAVDTVNPFLESELDKATYVARKSQRVVEIVDEIPGALVTAPPANDNRSQADGFCG